MKRYDDDRPQLLNEMLLPQTIKRRIQGAVTSPDLPQTYFFTGPTGVGKTTAARIVVRVRLCEGRDPTTPDPCGRCEACRLRVGNYSGNSLYDEFSGDSATEDRIHDSVHWALSDQQVLFIDELQDAPPKIQRYLRKEIEDWPGILIVATTHRDSLDDALLNRLKAFEYALQRPSLSAACQFLTERFVSASIRCESPEHLKTIVEGYKFEMRPISQFPKKVLRENRGIVDEEFVREMFPDSFSYEVAGSSRPLL
jgi:replication-associated recombination protein RarA